MKLLELYNRLFSKHESMFEMANLRKKETGLPVNIFVSSGGSINKRHSPRIKVMYDTSDRFNAHATVSVVLKPHITIDDIVGYEPLPTYIFSAIKAYIELNYDVLIKYWNDEIDTIEMSRELKKLT